ncbi:MAG: TIGR02281 family clan AA aspartic protease [Gammaproteobacteria bacterium]|jgi:aspartyl protease family protein|nr:TIGR02281 family clan AA aspartic protease [Gammaproteobacteria bacterium]
MSNKNQRDFISRAGITMTVIAWLIFLAILFGLFDYFSSQRYNPNQNVATAINGLQKEISLQRNAYGHYVAGGTINGYDVTFLLDTGASDVAIPESLANKIGLSKGYRFYVKTANGNTVAYQTHLDSVAIGDIKRYDLNATILTNMTGDEVLLGMNFLKHFEIIQKGQSLTIRQ